MFLFAPWVILSIFSGLASNIFAYFNRALLKDKDDPVVYAWYFETLRTLILSVVAIFDWKLIITPQSLLIFTLLGLSEWIAIYWYMKMHSHSHLSVSSIISRTRLIWVAVLAFLIVGERLTLFEYIGIAILFFGLSIVVAPKKLLMDKGARYANLAAVMIAFNIVLIKLALPYASNSVINIVIGLPSIFLFPLFMKNSYSRIRPMFEKRIWIKSLAVIINVVSILLFAAALRVGETGKVTAIYQGMLIFSVLAGIIFLKERDNIGKKLIGTAVTLIGVLLLTVI